tara:strand:+ start:1531 stop:1824 length:294 start_codon:yes stop_codon:yes gene_type:complete
LAQLDRGEALFLVSFGFFLPGGRKDRTDNTKKKERKKQQERERNERERKRERKNLRERESPSTKNTTTKAPLFAEKKNTENFVSQHIKWRAQKRRQS